MVDLPDQTANKCKYSYTSGRVQLPVTTEEIHTTTGTNVRVLQCHHIIYTHIHHHGLVWLYHIKGEGQIPTRHSIYNLYDSKDEK